ncbi:glycosyltransferase family 2 protein [Candidatus Collierbacteria bacterium]|nr:glycosyltransferase family 2 protein [Candidatus Collierbacteria bacterium]
MKLTAIVLIGQNDKMKAKQAIDSLSFADEIIVVKEKFPINDFGEVRNRALDRAKGEWVLFVDSDEKVTQQLAREIKRVIKFSSQGYFLQRQDKFLGRWLKHGETASVKLLRLAKKNAGRWVRPVHEVWKVKGETGELKNPLLHYSHEAVEGMVEKLDRYSGMEAGYKNRQMVRWLEWLKWLNCIRLISFPVGKFVLNYFFRLGFLDGMEGFIHAGMMSGHSFLVRAKLLKRYESTCQISHGRSPDGRANSSE